MSEKRNIRVTAVGDLHCTKTSQGKLQVLFQQISENADILPLCGDLVDYGQLEEATVLAKELAPIKIPMLAVLGNHEYESGQQLEVQRVLVNAGVTILEPVWLLEELWRRLFASQKTQLTICRYAGPPCYRAPSISMT